jgi:hypothetical protein
MKHGTLIAATIVSIFTLGYPLVGEAGGRGFSLPRSSGGGRSNSNGGGSNWSGGRSNGGSNYGNRPSSNYNYQQNYPGTTSSYQYQNPSGNNGGWTQQNSAPSFQSNSITAYKPQAAGNLQVVPLSSSKPISTSIGGGLNLTNPTNGGSAAGIGISKLGTKGGSGGNGAVGDGKGGGKGGKGKFAFAIVGGQLRQVMPSDDGSWVTADPGGTDIAGGDDSQAPVTVDLAGQKPTAAITLLNPLETRATVNFNLASQNGSLQSGYAAQASSSDPQLIVFDRGGPFGQAQYTLSPGAAYRFVATDQGWDLRTVTQ